MNNIVSENYIESLSIVIKYIFSWLILLPIAVIVTGKLLSKPINLGSDSKQVLKIPLKIISLEANDGEVILGFACLLIIIFIVAMTGGQEVQELVKVKFGVDPGQFHSICFFSSLISVVCSFILFVVHYLMTKVGIAPFVEDKTKYEATISRLSNKEKE